MALGAEFRPALDMAAMMANEDATETMLDQPGRAIGAFEAMSAGAAEGERRVTTTVEEE